jgi:hypothetical protein
MFSIIVCFDNTKMVNARLIKKGKKRQTMVVIQTVASFKPQTPDAAHN